MTRNGLVGHELKYHASLHPVPVIRLKPVNVQRRLERKLKGGYFGRK